MKRELCIVALAVALIFALLAGAANVDDRSLEGNGNPVFRIEVPQLTMPDGDANAVTDTINLNGTIRQITVTVNDNTGNATMTAEVIDEDSAVLWTEAAIAEAAVTVFQYNTRSSTDLPMALLATGTLTIQVTPSGDPGASTGLVDIVLYGD
jgi:hypothetical protein